MFPESVDLTFTGSSRASSCQYLTATCSRCLPIYTFLRFYFVPVLETGDNVLHNSTGGGGTHSLDPKAKNDYTGHYRLIFSWRLLWRNLSVSICAKVLAFEGGGEPTNTRN